MTRDEYISAGLTHLYTAERSSHSALVVVTHLYAQLATANFLAAQLTPADPPATPAPATIGQERGKLALIDGDGDLWFASLDAPDQWILSSGKDRDLTPATRGHIEMMYGKSRLVRIVELEAGAEDVPAAD